MQYGKYVFFQLAAQCEKGMHDVTAFRSYLEDHRSQET